MIRIEAGNLIRIDFDSEINLYLSNMLVFYLKLDLL
jgi:hypothetical protein